jgi:diphthine synthase
MFLMVLYLIGLGLWDEKDISVKGLELAKSCDIIYMEEYTSKLGVSKGSIENMLGKPVKILLRKDVEQSDVLIKDAKKKDVAFLVGGDPLAATTHIDLLIQARKQKIKTRVIHSSSIYTAICESGLFIYKFGKSCSMPFPAKGFNPTSFYEVITDNQKNGAHTIVFLDLHPEEDRFMTINQALETLVKLGLSEETIAVGFARMGSEDQIIKAGKIKELIKFDFGKPQHVLVIPGKLHFIEEEALGIK